ncbi:MAG: succinate dehydrogenase, cytochrome b556 subunit [Nitrosomonas sp.]|nr:succinate dehydrogenase, cytochrome b556 subunit [Nitrosomonas sp.]MDP1951405.1 succinate dehydrogenase, cytochrome b556 subunit [Nitrosomonas sp.]
MEAKLQNKRPKHLDLLKIRHPLPSVVSILHRLSGVLLFFPGIPLLLCGLQSLLDSEQSYAALAVILLNPVVKIMLLLSAWFSLHHLCAGIRYLLLDLHYGVTLPQARASSKLVLMVGVMLTLLIGRVIW